MRTAKHCTFLLYRRWWEFEGRRIISVVTCQSLVSLCKERELLVKSVYLFINKATYTSLKLLQRSRA